MGAGPLFRQTRLNNEHSLPAAAVTHSSPSAMAGGSRTGATAFTGTPSVIERKKQTHQRPLSAIEIGSAKRQAGVYPTSMSR